MNVKAPICENKCLLNLKKLKKMKTLILKKFISTFKVDVSNIDTSFLKENEFYQTQLENSFKYFLLVMENYFFMLMYLGTKMKSFILCLMLQKKLFGLY